VYSISARIFDVDNDGIVDGQEYDGHNVTVV